MHTSFPPSLSKCDHFLRGKRFPVTSACFFWPYKCRKTLRVSCATIHAGKNPEISILSLPDIMPTVPRLTKNSSAVQLLRSKLDNNEVSGKDNTTVDRSSEPKLQVYPLANFCTRYNVMRKEYCDDVAQLAVLWIIIAWRVPLYAWVDPMTWISPASVRRRRYIES